MMVHHNSPVYTWVFQVKKQTIGFHDNASTLGIQSYNFFYLDEFN